MTVQKNVWDLVGGKSNKPTYSSKKMEQQTIMSAKHNQKRLLQFLGQTIREDGLEEKKTSH